MTMVCAWKQVLSMSLFPNITFNSPTTRGQKWLSADTLSYNDQHIIQKGFVFKICF